MVSFGGELCVVPAKVTWNDLGQDLVIFNTEKGSYHALNATGSEIWRILVGGGTAGGITDELARRFGGDREGIATDVVAFLEDAHDSGLIVEAR